MFGRKGCASQAKPPLSLIVFGARSLGNQLQRFGHDGPVHQRFAGKQSGLAVMIVFCYSSPQIKASCGASVAEVSAVLEALRRVGDVLHDVVVTSNQSCRDYPPGQEPSSVLLTQP